MKYTDIKTYEDACADQKKDPIARPDYSKCELSPAEEDFNLTVFLLARIIVSVNKDENGEEWKPAPTDRRHYPWAYIEEDKTKPSGSGLSLRDVANDDSVTGVAARLTCRDAPRARYLFEQFKPLWERILIFHH